jgi:hypothetical protein
MLNMLKHMVLKGFKLSDNDELPDEQDGCLPVHLQMGSCTNMQKYAKYAKYANM